MITERQIEQVLKRKVGQKGGLALKLVSPGFDGVPDRMVLLPGRRAVFVELKAPGQRMRPLQVKRKRQLESLWVSVYFLDSIEGIEVMLNEICAT